MSPQWSWLGPRGSSDGSCATAPCRQFVTAGRAAPTKAARFHSIHRVHVAAVYRPHGRLMGAAGDCRPGLCAANVPIAADHMAAIAARRSGHKAGRRAPPSGTRRPAGLQRCIAEPAITEPTPAAADMLWWRTLRCGAVVYRWLPAKFITESD